MFIFIFHLLLFTGWGIFVYGVNPKPEQIQLTYIVMLLSCICHYLIDILNTLKNND